MLAQYRESVATSKNRQEEGRDAETSENFDADILKRAWLLEQESSVGGKGKKHQIENEGDVSYLVLV